MRLHCSTGLHKLTPHPPSSATDDPLAQAILQCCGPDAVAAYHQGRPYCLGDVHWLTLPKASKAVASSLWDRNCKEEGIMTMPKVNKQEKMQN